MSWVKLVSPQTIHIAMCLQFLVEEMLRLRKRKAIKKPSDRVGKFKPRRQKKKVDLGFLTTGEDAAAAEALRIAVSTAGCEVTERPRAPRPFGRLRLHASFFPRRASIRLVLHHPTILDEHFHP